MDDNAISYKYLLTLDCTWESPETFITSSYFSKLWNEREENKTDLKLFKTFMSSEESNIHHNSEEFNVHHRSVESNVHYDSEDPIFQYGSEESNVNHKEHKNSLLCNLCNKSFYNKSSLQRHKKLHCPVCEKIFNKRDLKSHIEIHDNERTHNDETGDQEKTYCYICNKYFSGITSRAHMRNHIGEKPHCKLCNRSFNHKSNLIKHLRTHNSEKPYNCSVCSKHFRRKDHLKYHYRTHPGVDTSHLSHPDTEKSKLQSYTNAHIGENLPLKPHFTRSSEKSNCKLCDQKTCNCALLIFQCSDKPYCTLCDKVYSSRSVLWTHIRRHTEAKPFHCTICTWKFSKKSSLTRHKRTHMDNKPFTCSFCKKKFNKIDNFSSHLCTHKKEKL